MPNDLVRSSSQPPLSAYNGAGASMRGMSDPGAAGGDEDGAPVDWRRRLWALWRFKWLIALLTVVGAAVGIVVSPRVRPVYEVTANVWISAPSPSQQPRDDGPIRAEELLASTSWGALFKSFTVVDSVVMTRHSYISTQRRADVPAFDSLHVTSDLISGSYTVDVDATGHSYTLSRAADSRAPARVVETGIVGDSVGRKIGIAWRPSAKILTPARSLTFHVTTPRSAALALLDSLTTDLPPNSSFMKLTLKGMDPVASATTLNVWVKQFVSTATDLKKRNVTEFTRILSGQLHYAENQLRDADNALETFRVKTITLPSEETPVVPGLESTKGVVVDAFFKLKVDYDNVKRDREALQDITQDVAAGKAPADAIASIPGVLTMPGAEQLSGALAELRTKQSDLRTKEAIYTPENEIIKTAQADITTLQRQTIPAFANELLGSLALRESDLQKRIGIQSKEMQDIPTRTIEEAKLKREVGLAENLYTGLQTRYDAATLQEASLVPDVSALDMALPPDAPSTNTKFLIRVLGVAGGLALGIILALILDILDVRFRYPSQVESQLGLPIYGSVPVFNKRRMHDPMEQSQLVEAFRSLRLQLHQLAEAGRAAHLRGHEQYARRREVDDLAESRAVVRGGRISHASRSTPTPAAEFSTRRSHSRGVLG